MQADLAPSAAALPPDSTAPHPDLLAVGAAPVAAVGQQLQQHLQANREAAAVLAGLASWLPQELVDSVAAASAGGLDGNSSSNGPAEGGISGSGGVEGAEGAAVSSGVSGVSLWREEARVAASVVELVSQLEDTWGDVLTRLEQAQVRVANIKQ